MKLWLGLVLLAALVVAALFAPMLAPHDPQAQDILNALSPPAWEADGTMTYPLGTDSLGRDIVSQILYGSRTALIVAIADQRDRAALVFDEIDAGIGGATALAVGTRFGRLARVTQVVVITHLAQIASWADAHYALRKHDVRGATVIELETLDAKQARLEEIARMLSGDANPVSLKHAATLVAGARSS